MTRIYPLRILLTLTLAFALFWIWSDRVDELSYFLVPQSLQDLGNVVSVKDFDSVSDNTYVRLTGVLGNKAATVTGVRTGSFRYGPIQIRNMLGSPIFVEYDESRYGKTFAPFQEVTVSGRIVAFDERSELKHVRGFLIQKLKLKMPEHARILIVDEKPFGDWRYPLLFLLSLIALMASFWSALRGKDEPGAY